jgi:hypothetical protein
MPAFNAVGMDAVGSSGSATSASSASLSCSLSSTSGVTAVISTSIKLSAILLSASALTSALSSPAAQLTANLASASTLSASSLSSGVRFTALLISQSTVSGDLTTSQAIPMFTPSTARTITVQSTSPMFTGGRWWTLTDPKKPRGAKDPDATIDVTFDWTPWLDDIGSVQISEVTFTLNGVSSVGSFSDGSKVTVFITGGTAGSAATVACKIKTLTTPSRTDERTVYIDVAEE